MVPGVGGAFLGGLALVEADLARGEAVGRLLSLADDGGVVLLLVRGEQGRGVDLPQVRLEPRVDCNGTALRSGGEVVVRRGPRP